MELEDLNQTIVTNRYKSHAGKCPNIGVHDLYFLVGAIRGKIQHAIQGA